MTQQSRMTSLFGDLLDRPKAQDSQAVVIKPPIAGLVDVQLSSGEVLRRVKLVGGAAVGDTVTMRYTAGEYTALASGAASSLAGGTIVLGSGGSTGSFSGAPSPHDLLGVHHTLPVLSANLFLASPTGSGGFPSFRAISPTDLPGQFSGFGNPTALVGLTAINGSATTAMRSDAAPAINAAIAPTWSGLHTFNAGATIAAGQYLNFGADVALTRFGANVLATGADDSVRSPNFVSGIAGWTIDGTGDAEFNNIVVRGELRAFVFKINELAATAGTFGVFYSAATTYADFTTPATTGSSFTFQAKNTDAGAMLLGVNDVCRTKAWNGAGIVDAWFTVTARTNSTNNTTYTATLNSGSTSATIREGTAIVDYGPNSGTSGFITLSADGTVGSSPNITLATHAGAPWTTITPQMRIGNLNGYGSYATNVYGIAIGNPAGAWMTAEGNVVRMRQGANDVIVLDGGANSSYFAGVVTIGTSGEIRQGTGTLGSNYTGLRIWNSSGIGLIAGYNSNVVQWQAGTDGKLYAGANIVKLDVDGVSVGYTGSWNGVPANTSPSAIKFFTSGYDVGGSAGNYLLSAIKKTSWSQSTVTYQGLDVNVLAVYPPIGGGTATPVFTVSLNGSQCAVFGGANATFETGSIKSSSSITAAGAVYASNWVRTYGDTGWYSETYGGGLYMTDTTWVRTYNGKSIYTTGQVYADTIGIGASPANNNYDRLTIYGGIRLNSAWSGYQLEARDNSGQVWTTYATGNSWRVWQSQDLIRFDNSGNASKLSAGTAWTSFSDKRVKVIDGDYLKGLKDLLKIKPILYEYNGLAGTIKDGKKHAGIVAQDIQELFPEMVRVDAETGYLLFDPSDLLYVLINAVKELNAQIEDLKLKLK